MKLQAYFLMLMIFVNIAHSSATNYDWAKKSLIEMTLDEKIGQLFLVAGYIDEDFAFKETKIENYQAYLKNLIQEHSIGGIAYIGLSQFQMQQKLTNAYQTISKYPLLIAQDLEWGLGMRLTDGFSFPKNATLAFADTEMTYKMGLKIAEQAKVLGVHINLSPVVDVNSHKDNIVINVRSFGSDPEMVAEKATAMIQGLQEGGMIASAKHFPGLGNIYEDPHINFPKVESNKKHFYEIDLSPFKECIKVGVKSIQTEHVWVPHINEERIPASLSKEVVTDLLIEEMQFTGLIISGALRMNAIVENFTEEEIAIKAFIAGHDMLLMPKDFLSAKNALKNAFLAGLLKEEDLDKRVLKILKLKEDLKITENRWVDTQNCSSTMLEDALKLKENIYTQAVHKIRDENKFLSLNNAKKIAYIHLGESSHFLIDKDKTDFYAFSLENLDEALLKKLKNKMDDYEVLLVDVHPANPRRIQQIRLLNKEIAKVTVKKFTVHGLTNTLLSLKDFLSSYKQKVIINYFGNVYGLPYFDAFPTLIMAHEDEKEAKLATKKIIGDL